ALRRRQLRQRLHDEGREGVEDAADDRGAKTGEHGQGRQHGLLLDEAMTKALPHRLAAIRHGSPRRPWQEAKPHGDGMRTELATSRRCRSPPGRPLACAPPTVAAALCIKASPAGAGSDSGHTGPARPARPRPPHRCGAKTAGKLASATPPASAAATAGSTALQETSSFSVASASARVRPRLTSATGLPSCTAARTKR